jgi:hypothetical protein
LALAATLWTVLVPTGATSGVKTLQMMLRDNLLLGSGPDTFVYNFPHWDPHRDHKLFRIGMLIDKPHSN